VARASSAGRRRAARDVLDPRVEAALVEGDVARLTLRTGLAWRDGRRIPGVELVRRFELRPDGLAVVDELHGAARARLELPRGARVDADETAPSGARRVLWRLPRE
jgi:hypothetical protein